MGMRERIEPVGRSGEAGRALHLVGNWTIVIGVTGLMLGGWAFFRPEPFFYDFPVPGADWVSTLGHYNEHLIRDFGSAEIGLGIAAIGVGHGRSYRGMLWVLTGIIVFGVLHLVFHLGTLAMFSVGSAITQLVALLAFVVLPAVLLAILRIRPDAP